MAKGSGTSIGGPTIASGARGGSSPLGGKGSIRGLAIIGGGAERTGSGSPIQARLFSTDRGRGLNDFLSKVKGSDLRGKSPALTYQPFLGSEISKIKATAIPFVPAAETPKAETKPSNIILFPQPKVEPIKAPVISSKSSKGEIRFFPTIRPTEAPKVVREGAAKPRVEAGVSIKITKLPERTGLTAFEQRAFVEKVRANLKQIRGIRTRFAVTSITDPETQTETSLSVRTAAKTVIGVVSKTETQPGGASDNIADVSPRTSNDELLNKSRRKRKVSRAPKLIVDELANRARESALISARDRWSDKNPGIIDNEAVGRESAITSKEFGSGILIGTDRPDGTPPRILKALRFIKDALSNGQIKELVIRHTAVDIGEGRTVNRKQIDEVLTLPEELVPPVDPAQLLPKKTELQVIETQERLGVAEGVVGYEDSKDLETKVVEDLAFEATGRNVNFVGASLDKVLHNNNVILFNNRPNIVDEIDEGEQLIAA